MSAAVTVHCGTVMLQLLASPETPSHAFSPYAFPSSCSNFPAVFVDHHMALVLCF